MMKQLILVLTLSNEAMRLLVIAKPLDTSAIISYRTGQKASLSAAMLCQSLRWQEALQESARCTAEARRRFPVSATEDSLYARKRVSI